MSNNPEHVASGYGDEYPASVDRSELYKGAVAMSRLIEESAQNPSAKETTYVKRTPVHFVELPNDNYL